MEPEEEEESVGNGFSERLGSRGRSSGREKGDLANSDVGLRVTDVSKTCEASHNSREFDMLSTSVGEDEFQVETGRYTEFVCRMISCSRNRARGWTGGKGVAARRRLRKYFQRRNSIKSAPILADTPMIVFVVDDEFPPPEAAAKELSAVFRGMLEDVFETAFGFGLADDDGITDGVAELTIKLLVVDDRGIIAAADARETLDETGA